MVIIGTFAIIHRGYLEIFDKYPTADIFIISDQLAKDNYQLEIDLRKMPFAEAKKLLSSLNRNIEELTIDKIEKIKQTDKIILIKDDLVDNLQSKYLQNLPNIIEENGYFYHQTNNVYKTEEKKPEVKISQNKNDLNFMQAAIKLAKDSGCFWRQIASVIVKNNKIIYQAYNQMLPNNDECYKIGCIRDNIKPGTQTEICSAIHSEANCIAKAAKEGVSLKNASIYVTTFPCPACAKLIALSGLKKCFYNQGWANFDGERILQAAGVEIIKVEL
jgi:dCMP deaminase